MAGKNDKWLMFRNYMANELGITKEDIREWIQDITHEEVKNVVANAYGRVDIESEIRHAIQENDYWGNGKTFGDGVKREVANILADRIDVKYTPGTRSRNN